MNDRYGLIGAMAQANAYGTMAQQAGAMNVGLQPAPPKSPMQAHAETVHEHAIRLQDLNGRLCQAIDRIAGPAPEVANASKDQPPPSGALMVAQFGAERVNMSLGRLADLVSRLENIV